MRIRRGTAIAAACAALLAGVTACGSTTEGPSGDDAAAGPVQLYGTDGNMISSFGDEFDQPGTLRGMKAPRP